MSLTKEIKKELVELVDGISSDYKADQETLLAQFDQALDAFEARIKKEK